MPGLVEAEVPMVWAANISSPPVPNSALQMRVTFYFMVAATRPAA